MAAYESRIYVEAVCVWIKANKSAWRKLQAIVRNQVKSGYRVSRDSVYTLAMLRGMKVSELKEFKRDHNMWSTLARYMLMKDPSLWAGLRCKDADIDSVNLEEVFRETVNQGEFFHAHDWKEAKKLYEIKDAAA